jgi:hypothetical protein
MWSSSGFGVGVGSEEEQGRKDGREHGLKVR